jgi:hypothetical protein
VVGEDVVVGVEDEDEFGLVGDCLVKGLLEFGGCLRSATRGTEEGNR